MEESFLKGICGVSSDLVLLQHASKDAQDGLNQKLVWLEATFRRHEAAQEEKSLHIDALRQIQDSMDPRDCGLADLHCALCTFQDRIH